MAKAIVLVGGEGCGKSTLMETLRKLASFLLVEMSDLIKAKAKIDSDFAAAVSEAVDNGTYLSCEVIEPLFLEHMIDISPTQDIVLGGCVRRKSQAKYVLQYLQSMGYEVQVVYLSLSEAECKERIAYRAKKAGVNARRRDLDKDAVQLSLNSFFAGIEEIIEYFEVQGVAFYKVSASLTPDEVFHQVCKKTAVKVKTVVPV